MTVLYAGEHLRAEVYNAEAEVLFVTFDHWRRDRDGFAEHTASTRVAEYGFAELNIKPARNDWYMNPDLEPLRKVLQDYTARYQAVRSFAFSMGAFAALLLSRSLHLRNAVLVSPQYSIFPYQPPWDTRYKREAEGVDITLGNLAVEVSPDLRGVVLFDPVGSPIDRAHARLILTSAPLLSGVGMAMGGHPATQVMQDTTTYGKLRALAFAGEVDPALYHALHVEARSKSKLYRTRLTERLAKRSAR